MMNTGEAAPRHGPGGASDFIGLAFHGLTITHLDSLCHPFWDGQMYNGKPASLVTVQQKATAGDIDKAQHGVVTRGVLLDITQVRGKEWLEAGDALLRWYKQLIDQKFDGSQQRRYFGRPRVEEEVEQLVVRMAAENPTWGYRRIQGALANLGHSIDKLTVRNILRRQHMEPVPQCRKAGMSWRCGRLYERVEPTE